MKKKDAMKWLVENISEWPTDIKMTCWSLDADFYWADGPLEIVIFSPDWGGEWTITKEEWEVECNPT